jgi:hypothetical protein
VREGSGRGAVDAYRQPVLECEAAVTRDVIRMRVRLEHADELHVMTPAGIQILLDGVSRVDDYCDLGLLVADKIGRTSEVVVDELLEEHDSDRSNARGYVS